MALYAHPVTGEVSEYIPYDELTDEQRALVDDVQIELRKSAALQNLGLDRLAGDKNRHVRTLVAEKGFDLERFLVDESRYVRMAVARQNFRLDVLSSDKDGMVRAAVARMGYDLPRLCKDRSWSVRREVARQGYGLDRLSMDRYKAVRQAAEEFLAERGITLDEWAILYPSLCSYKRTRQRALSATPSNNNETPERFCSRNHPATPRESDLDVR